MGDVLAVLPFQNTLSTFNITGAGIVAALENGVSQVEDGAGRFPQVAGLRFTWDPKVAPMEGRIKSVEVREGDAWVPIDPAKIYPVASNNFMRNGGDGYVSLRDEATNAYDFGPGLENVLADYLVAQPRRRCRARTGGSPGSSDAASAAEQVAERVGAAGSDRARSVDDRRCRGGPGVPRRDEDVVGSDGAGSSVTRSSACVVRADHRPWLGPQRPAGAELAAERRRPAGDVGARCRRAEDEMSAEDGRGSGDRACP